MLAVKSSEREESHISVKSCSLEKNSLCLTLHSVGEHKCHASGGSLRPRAVLTRNR
jgi:hypothetical protein